MCRSGGKQLELSHWRPHSTVDAVMDIAMDITATDFEREVIEGSKQQLVLVDFWAPWCGPCRALTPVLEKVAAEFAGKFVLVKANTDELQEAAARFNVSGI